MKLAARTRARRRYRLRVRHVLVTETIDAFEALGRRDAIGLRRGLLVTSE